MQKNCPSVYIGQTSRALKNRIKEHKRAINNLDENSQLACHHLTTNHDINLEEVEIIDRCEQWSQRLFLEAWHSACINGNECMHNASNTHNTQSLNT